MQLASLTILVRSSLVSALLMLLFGAYMRYSQQFSTGASSKDLGSPGLAMQFATTSGEARAIMPHQSDRAVMAKGQRLDFFFIGIYWSFYTLLALLLAQRIVRGSRVLAVAVWLFASFAAWFDLREDLAILEVINHGSAVEDSLVASVAAYSHLKWSMAFAATLLLSALFIPRDDLGTGTGKVCAVIGFALAGSAILGWLGLMHHPLILLAGAMMIIALILSSALFAFAPSRFLGGSNFR